VEVGEGRRDGMGDGDALRARDGACVPGSLVAIAREQASVEKERSKK
jgi:hypothetical protein